jgi:hypothetical protein
MVEHLEEDLISLIHLFIQTQVQVVVEVQPIQVELLVALVLALVTTVALQHPQQAVVAVVHQQ